MEYRFKTALVAVFFLGAVFLTSATTYITPDYVNTTGYINATSINASLDCSLISNAASDLCTLADTDTDTHATTLPASNITGLTYTTTLPIGNITSLIGSKACTGTDKAVNVTISASGVSVVCTADIDTDTIITTLPAGNITGLAYTTSLPASNITGLAYTTSLPAGNITGLTYTTTLPIGNITNLISSYACTGSDQLTNITINSSGIFGVCTAQGTATGADGWWPITGWLYNNSGSLDVNISINSSFQMSCANITGATSDLCTLVDTQYQYTHLTNFTDDLGDRGYTVLSNFTNDLGNAKMNVTNPGDFNVTGTIGHNSTNPKIQWIDGCMLIG